MNTVLFILGIGFTLFLFWRFWFFLRDPQRMPPAGNGFLAPADGYVIYVKKVNAGEVPISIKKRKHIKLDEITGLEALKHKSGVLIGIFMTAFSVHHNRIPFAGRVIFKHRQKGKNNFTTARLMTNILLGRKPYEQNCDHIIENERVSIGIETTRGCYTLTQIADKWISYIINDTSIGDTLERGERFGMIRFGSQVDVFLLDEMDVSPLVRPGDYVSAGKTILTEPTKKYHFSLATHKDNQDILKHVRKNPIKMEIHYIMDRHDDFFKLHKLHGGSIVLIARNRHTNEIAACVSILKFKGNIAAQQVDFQYITDLIKDSEKGSGLLMQNLLDYGSKKHFDTDFIIGLVNKKNFKARMFSRNRKIFPAKIVAAFDYHEIIPLSKHRLPSSVNFQFPTNDQLLEKALQFINAHYRDHLLFQTLDLPLASQMFDHLPGFGPQNIVMLYKKNHLKGVMIYFDPSEMVSMVIKKMDRLTSILITTISAIHKLTGLLFSPPKKGEKSKTLQVRHLAGNEEAQRLLLSYVNNLAFAKKVSFRFHVNRCEGENINPPPPAIGG